MAGGQSLPLAAASTLGTACAPCGCVRRGEGSLPSVPPAPSCRPSPYLQGQDWGACVRGGAHLKC